jgi:hypothetical protein
LGEVHKARDTLANVITATPDWTRLPTGLPPAIRLLVERCLVKDRHERLGDVSTVKFLLSQNAALAAATSASPSLARTAARPGPAWIAAAILLAAAAAAGAWWLKAVPDEKDIVLRFRYPLSEGQEFVGAQRHTAISPDGTRIVYAANRQLYLRPLNQVEALPIPGTADDPVSPVFSPDGQWIAYATRPRGTLKKIAVSGGTSVTLAELPTFPSEMSWKNGAIMFGLAAGESSGISSVPEGGGAIKKLVAIDPKVESALQPELLDDTHVLFTVRRLDVPAALGGFSVVVQALDGSPRKTLVKGASSAQMLTTGQLAYLADGTIRIVSFDARRLEITGEPVVTETAVARFSVGRTGTLVYEGALPTPNRVLVWIDRNGSERPISVTPAGYFDVRLSRDGTQIAMCSAADIWIWSIAKETLRKLTLTTDAVEYNPL